MYTLSVYIAGEIDLFENLDIVHITLLVAELVLSYENHDQTTEDPSWGYPLDVLGAVWTLWREIIAKS